MNEEGSGKTKESSIADDEGSRTTKAPEGPAPTGSETRTGERGERLSLFVLVVDDDPTFGSVVAGLAFPQCDIRWVRCAEAEDALRDRRPDLIVGNRVSLTEKATAIIDAHSAAASRPTMIFRSVPPWALEPLVLGLADEAARDERNEGTTVNVKAGPRVYGEISDHVSRVALLLRRGRAQK